MEIYVTVSVGNNMFRSCSWPFPAFLGAERTAGTVFMATDHEPSGVKSMFE